MTSLFSPEPTSTGAAAASSKDGSAQAAQDAADLRQQEQDRAEQNRIVATQDQLGQETLIRSRRYGTRSLLGSFGSGQSLLGAG